MRNLPRCVEHFFPSCESFGGTLIRFPGSDAPLEGFITATFTNRPRSLVDGEQLEGLLVALPLPFMSAPAIAFYLPVFMRELAGDLDRPLTEEAVRFIMDEKGLYFEEVAAHWSLGQRGCMEKAIRFLRRTCGRWV